MPNVQEANPINLAKHDPPKNHSNFNLSKQFGLTTKFGLNTPFFCSECVTDDGPITITPNCEVRSLSLKAPKFGNVSKHVSFYQVPLQSILPYNWEKLVMLADRGTDVQGSSSDVSGIVPALDGVNTVVSNLVGRLYSRFTGDFSALLLTLSTAIEDEDNQTIVSHILHFVIRWEMFFSHGNLLSHLGVHYGSTISIKNSNPTYPEFISFDKFSEILLGIVAGYRFSLVDDGGNDSVPAGFGILHVRKCLDFMRQHTGPFIVGSATAVVDVPSYSDDITAFDLVTRVSEANSEPLNFGRCLAYQIVNAHFFTNDKIDYIYNATLYRQYIYSLLLNLDLGSSEFVYNGISTPYDYLSGFYFNEVITASAELDYTSDVFWQSIYPYLNAIFGFNYSLRFMDYFVGARPRNLAIGDDSIRVVNNSVSVVDVTKNIVRQRFRNAVARTAHNIKDYSEDILGRATSYDWHDPKYLFSFDTSIFTSEIENTGVAQQEDPNSITAVMRGSNNGYEFTFDIDRFSYIVGIEYYDFRRFYFTTQERNTMAIDRFDMFIPELQYIGDQELKLSELFAGSDKAFHFGYTLRDMQWKQSFDDCAGGMVEYLPGWLFKYDPLSMSHRALSELHICPEFIRSQPTELDEFYIALTGMNMAAYFHFIELWDIKVSAHRPMSYAPQIL